MFWIFSFNYRNKRHLMCVGSIVNVQHVLTSATCIQEATYIRYDSTFMELVLKVLHAS